MPKVSIIIPAYNSMKYLPKTVDSVCQQTFSNWEILIINDGSTDNIAEWAVTVTDARVKLISQPNQGVSVARNTGLSHASGEYIAFLDADDLWKPTKLEKQVRCLDENTAVGLVYTWTALIDEFCKPIGRIFACNLEGNVWQKIVVNEVISNGSSPMVRRSCFDIVGEFDIDLITAEDRDMWTRIATCYPFAVIPEPLTLYRQHSQGLSKNRQQMMKDLPRVIEKNFQSAPLDLLYLRNHSYGQFYLAQAWNSLYLCRYQEAIKFRRQAILHHANLCFSENYIRLSIAIFMIRYLGANSYEFIRKLTRCLKQMMLNYTRCYLSTKTLLIK